MSHVFLVAKPQGTPILIAQTGMTIEPEIMSWDANRPYSGRSVITYPTKERISPGIITVAQSFDHFVWSLDDAKLLIRVEKIVEEAKAAAAPATELQPESVKPPLPENADTKQAVADIADAPPSRNRRKKEKA